MHMSAARLISPPLCELLGRSTKGTRLTPPSRQLPLHAIETAGCVSIVWINGCGAPKIFGSGIDFHTGPRRIEEFARGVGQLGLGEPSPMKRKFGARIGCGPAVT